MLNHSKPLRQRHGLSTAGFRINGSIPRLGKRYGIPTPVNETVVAIIKARESGFTA